MLEEIIMVDDARYFLITNFIEKRQLGFFDWFCFFLGVFFKLIPSIKHSSKEIKNLFIVNSYSLKLHFVDSFGLMLL